MSRLSPSVAVLLLALASCGGDGEDIIYDHYNHSLSDPVVCIKSYGHRDLLGSSGNVQHWVGGNEFFWTTQ